MTSQPEPPPTGPSIMEQDPVRLSMARRTVSPILLPNGPCRCCARKLPTSLPQDAKNARGWPLPAERLYRPCQVAPRLRSGLLGCVWLLHKRRAGAVARLGWRTLSIASFPVRRAPPQQFPVQGPHHTFGERPALPSLLPSPAAEPVTMPQSQTSDETAAVARPKRVTKAASPDDLGLLLDAMRALRVERNPTRARAC